MAKIIYYIHIYSLTELRSEELLLILLMCRVEWVAPLGSPGSLFPWPPSLPLQVPQAPNPRTTFLNTTCAKADCAKAAFATAECARAKFAEAKFAKAKCVVSFI